LDSPERLVPQVTVACKVLQVQLVSLDRLDRRVKLVSQVSWVSREPLVHRVSRVRVEKQVELDHWEQLEHLV
jgi:hypothetical protein